MSADIARAQRIAADVLREMPDADIREAFDEYVRRLSIPEYPKVSET